MLAQPPSEVFHGDLDPDELVIVAAIDGDLHILAAAVELHLQTGFIDCEGVDGALLDLRVEFQLEAVGEQVLEHGVEVVDAGGVVDPGFYVVGVVIEPFGAAFDLSHGDFVHQADDEFYGDVLGGIAGSSGERFDTAAAEAGL